MNWAIRNRQHNHYIHWVTAHNDRVFTNMGEFIVHLNKFGHPLSGSFDYDPDPILDGIDIELNSLVGLKNVKEDITRLIDFLTIQKKREEFGLIRNNNSLHMVFYGPPGTGKTSVARIIARIYKKLGFLRKGHLVEVDRSGLVAEYLGQTAIKTQKVIQSALGGVLFIDEAYSLYADKDTYGSEAINTLLKEMEDKRDDIAVVVTGYKKEMDHFLVSNPGLKSRFNRFFHFKHYGENELVQIFKIVCNQNDYLISEKAELYLHQLFKKVVLSRDEHFGNGRYIRNLFEKAIESNASRISKKTDIKIEDLKTITEVDIKHAEVY